MVSPRTITTCALLWTSAILANALIFFPKSKVVPSHFPLAGSKAQSRGEDNENYPVSYVSMPKFLPASMLGDVISMEPPVAGDVLQCIITDVHEHPAGPSLTMRGTLSSLENPAGNCLITCGLLENSIVSCIGNVRPSYLSGAQYELRSILNSTFHELKEVPYRLYEDDPDEEISIRSTIGARSSSSNIALGDITANAAKKRRLTDTNEILDVMVVYTPDTLKAIGSSDSVKLLTIMAIDEANMIFERSKIPLRLRLVHFTGMSDSNYADPANFNTILTQAFGYGGSYAAFDNEQDMRYTVKADALIILADETDSCGLAFLNAGGSASYQISVVAYDCAIGYYRFWNY